MTTDAIAHALLAVGAAGEGDTHDALAHIAQAQRHARSAARRDRQIIEIAALVVSRDRTRAAGLAMEHASMFPDDVELLGLITLSGRRCGPIGMGLATWAGRHEPGGMG